MFRFVQRRDAWVIALAAGALAACTDQIRLGLDRVGSGASIGAEAGVPSTAGASGAPAAAAGGSSGEFPLGGAGGALVAGGTGALPDSGECIQRACGGSLRECGDCDDDDSDGFIDASDPECLGACDDDEEELQTGAVMVAGSCNADCYFDRNVGQGDDDCDWSYRCDPLSVEPNFDPTGRAMCEHAPNLPDCDVSGLVACVESCRPLTPNGCDCFGCCEVPAASGRFIWVGAGADERPCTPVPDCQNPCDECELCVAKRELPASCSPGIGPSCPSGVRSCDPQTFDGCALSEYCITGCCVPLPT